MKEMSRALTASLQAVFRARKDVLRAQRTCVIYSPAGETNFLASFPLGEVRITSKEDMNLHSAVAVTVRFRAVVCSVTGVCLLAGVVFLAAGQTHAPASRATRKGNVMSVRASGTFEVKLTPRASEAGDRGADLVIMSIDKQFHGDLAAVSKGEMLADSMGEKGSGGYVAMERVSGTLHGRRGTFVLQHSGTMRRGAAQLSITVVPESGTGQLTGLEGKMTIKVADGKHSYDFEYTLAETPKSKAND